MASNGHAAAGSGGRPGVRPRTAGLGFSWPRALAVLALVALCAVVANSCQRSQIRVEQSRAVATARAQVDFRPAQQQIRLVRQGLTSRPYWAVSLSVPAQAGGFEQLAVVKVDANTGKVASVATQPPGDGG